MHSRFIRLQSIEEVKDFVKIVNRFPCDVDLSSGRYVVDAKSIMGLLSLDLSEPVTVTLHCADADPWLAELAPFLVNE